MCVTGAENCPEAQETWPGSRRVAGWAREGAGPLQPCLRGRGAEEGPASETPCLRSRQAPW